MRKTTPLALLTLFALLALPLAAADLPAAGAPIVETADAAPAPSITESAPEAAPEVSIDDLEALFDDGKVERACSQPSCDNYCKANYGPWSFGFCSGGACTCAI